MAKRRSKASTSKASSAASPKGTPIFAPCFLTIEKLLTFLHTVQAKSEGTTKVKKPAHDAPASLLPLLPTSNDDDTLEEDINEPRFTLFPKLPLELRRMIWTLALPDGRKVLFGRLKWKVSTEETYQSTDARHPQFPVLLRVNSESRRLTLENYILPCHDGPFRAFRQRKSTEVSPGKTISASTTCFDPARDLLCFTADGAFLQDNVLQWVKYYVKKYPTRMARIREIEISDVSVTPTPFDWSRCSNVVGNCFLRKLKGSITAQGPLRYFQHLEKIHVLPRAFNPINLWYSPSKVEYILSRGSTYHRTMMIHTPEQKEACKKELLQYFELVNEDLKTKADEKCKVPEIVFKIQ